MSKGHVVKLQLGFAATRHAIWTLAIGVSIHAQAAGFAHVVVVFFVSTFQQKGSETITALQTAAMELEALLNNAPRDTFQFSLPGEIEIQSLFGTLAFDRTAPSWDVSFGGRLAYPDINALFDVPLATLNSDGDFSTLCL